MSPIRHDGIILIGVVVLGVISGFAPAAWTGAALLVSIGVNRSTRIIAGAGRDNAGEGLVRMLFLVSAVSIILAIVFAILLLINFGWIIGASFAVLFFAYFAVKEDSNAKAKREVARTRALLQDYVAQREAGKLTQDLLEKRSSITLRDNLPGVAHNLDFLYDPLLVSKREVEVRTSVIHTITPKRVFEWLNGGAKTSSNAPISFRASFFDLASLESSSGIAR